MAKSSPAAPKNPNAGSWVTITSEIESTELDLPTLKEGPAEVETVETPLAEPEQSYGDAAEALEETETADIDVEAFGPSEDEDVGGEAIAEEPEETETAEEEQVEPDDVDLAADALAQTPGETEQVEDAPIEPDEAIEGDDALPEEPDDVEEPEEAVAGADENGLDEETPDEEALPSGAFDDEADSFDVEPEESAPPEDDLASETGDTDAALADGSDETEESAEDDAFADEEADLGGWTDASADDEETAKAEFYSDDDGLVSDEVPADEESAETDPSVPESPIETADPDSATTEQTEIEDESEQALVDETSDEIETVRDEADNRFAEPEPEEAEADAAEDAGGWTAASDEYPVESSSGSDADDIAAPPFEADDGESVSIEIESPAADELEAGPVEETDSEDDIPVGESDDETDIEEIDAQESDAVESDGWSSAETEPVVDESDRQTDEFAAAEQADEAEAAAEEAVADELAGIDSDIPAGSLDDEGPEELVDDEDSARAATLDAPAAEADDDPTAYDKGAPAEEAADQPEADDSGKRGWAGLKLGRLLGFARSKEPETPDEAKVESEEELGEEEAETPVNRGSSEEDSRSDKDDLASADEESEVEAAATAPSDAEIEDFDREDDVSPAPADDMPDAMHEDEEPASETIEAGEEADHDEEAGETEDSESDDGIENDREATGVLESEAEALEEEAGALEDANATSAEEALPSPDETNASEDETLETEAVERYEEEPDIEGETPDGDAEPLADATEAEAETGDEDSAEDIAEADDESGEVPEEEKTFEDTEDSEAGDDALAENAEIDDEMIAEAAGAEADSEDDERDRTDADRVDAESETPADAEELDAGTEDEEPAEDLEESVAALDADADEDAEEEERALAEDGKREQEESDDETDSSDEAERKSPISLIVDNERSGTLPETEDSEFEQREPEEVAEEPQADEEPDEAAAEEPAEADTADEETAEASAEDEDATEPDEAPAKPPAASGKYASLLRSVYRPEGTEPPDKSGATIVPADLPDTVEGETRLVSTNPATGEAIWEAEIGDADKEVAIAREHWPEWASQSVSYRVETLRRFVNVVRSKQDEFAALIATETGKPLWETQTEVEAVMAKVEISVEAFYERTPTRKKEGAMSEQNALRHRPHGVLAVLGPFNFPVHLANGHMVPALIAGNAIVFKPSEKTPASGEFLVQCYREAGVPEGVVRVLIGGVAQGRQLAANPDIDGLLFTGSVRGGMALHQQFADRPDKILALELGGNNPLIVWDAPDLDSCATIAVQSAFMTAGQRCTAARRLIVEDGKHEKFIETLSRLTERLIVGPPDSDPQPFMGCVIDNHAADMVMDGYRDLVIKGGKPIVEMTRPDDTLPFVTPALIDTTDVENRPDEEIFGPLLQVIRVPDFEAALAEANNTKFGLSASLLSGSPQLYNQFWMAIRAGIVNWNKPTNGASSAAPFGGIGLSGNHRPSAFYAADYCAYPVASAEAPAPRASIGIGLADPNAKRGDG